VTVLTPSCWNANQAEELVAREMMESDCEASTAAHEGLNPWT
jgi:hypothetical protein